MLGDFCSKNSESVTKKFKKFATLQNLASKVKADIMLFFMWLCEELKDSQKIYIYRVFNTIVIKGLWIDFIIFEVDWFSIICHLIINHNMYHVQVNLNISMQFLRGLILETLSTINWCHAWSILPSTWQI